MQRSLLVLNLMSHNCFVRRCRYIGPPYKIEIYDSKNNFLRLQETRVFFCQKRILLTPRYLQKAGLSAVITN